MSVPANVSRALLAAEVPAIAAWAQRSGWHVEVKVSDLSLAAEAPHPASKQTLHLRGRFDQYDYLPPRWACVDREGKESGWTVPAPGPVPNGSGGVVPSVFIGHGAHGVICAPFNRNAYAEHGGPHPDWKGPAAWKSVVGHVRALSIAEMLDVIRMHLLHSPGWLP